MKKLYKHIAFFIMPFLLASFILIYIPYDKKYAYHKITGGCSVEYAYQRIVEDTSALDIAFIGSSKTHAGINDLLVGYLLQQQYSLNYSVANLSFCGTGRNLQYSIIKELFKHKKLKLLLIEVREIEQREGHISFGVIADANDILKAPLLHNNNYIKDIFNGLKSRMDYLRWGKKTDLSYSGPFHGFAANYKDADTIYLNYFKSRKLQDKVYAYLPHSNYQHALYYLQKILDLAHENNCQVGFIFLSSFGYIIDNAQHLDFYKQYGPVFFPPKKIIDNPAYWSDQNHLKRNGADSISAWITQEIVGEMKMN